MSSSNIDNLQIRSESVQEVLSNPPSWLVRYGITLIFGIIVLILLVSWWVKYPDFVEAPTTITSQTPPQKMQSRVNTPIAKLFVQNQEEVQPSQLLVVLQSNAHIPDMLKLRSLLDSVNAENINAFPIAQISTLNIGELENDFTTLRQAYNEYQLHHSLQPYQVENTANTQMQSELQTRIATLQSQQKIEKAKYNLAKKNYDRANTLHQQGVISAQELETENINLLQAQQNLKNLQLSISQLRNERINSQKVIKGTHINHQKDNTTLKSNLIQAYHNFVKSYKAWEQNYLLISSTAGKVHFQQNLSENQHVVAGENLLTIQPQKVSSLLAKLSVPAANSGKVKNGQKVLIKLSNYPFQEFGIVEGKVQSLSNTVDKDGNYYAEVSLPNGLVTSYEKRIPFDKELTDTAQIVTEDLRLIERFFYQMRKLKQYN